MEWWVREGKEIFERNTRQKGGREGRQEHREERKEK